jgi:hypothetical protein
VTGLVAPSVRSSARPPRRRREAAPRRRAPAVPLPVWWLTEVRRRVATSERSLVELGIELARATGRTERWSHATISRFLSNDQPTSELADAFQRYFDLPPYVVYPRDAREAQALQFVVAGRPGDAMPETSRKERGR